MKECPKCHAKYDDSMNFCTKDGCQLVDLIDMTVNHIETQNKFQQDCSDVSSADVGTSQKYNKKPQNDNKIGGCLKKIVIAFIIMAIALVAFYNYIKNAATYLRAEPNQIGSVKAGGECKIEIDYDGYIWFINHKPDWVDIDENENDFTIKVASNRTGAAREGSITIQSGKQLAQVIIKQMGYATQMRASENSLKFSSSGGDETIRISTDGCGWEALFPDWISVDNNEDDAIISCKRNTGEYRTGSITFKEDNVSAIVFITQGGVCNNCHGEGEVSCSYCWGQGGSGFGIYYSQCMWCGGSGKFKCSVCNGSGERE